MPNGMTGGENPSHTSNFSPSAPLGHLPHQREAFALHNSLINPNLLFVQWDGGVVGLGLVCNRADGLSFHTIGRMIPKQVYITL